MLLLLSVSVFPLFALFQGVIANPVLDARGLVFPAVRRFVIERFFDAAAHLAFWPQVGTLGDQPGDNFLGRWLRWLFFFRSGAAAPRARLRRF